MTCRGKSTTLPKMYVGVWFNVFTAVLVFRSDVILEFVFYFIFNYFDSFYIEERPVKDFLRVTA